MIRMFLKHIVYEFCIDIFFHHLVKNFSNVKPEDYERMRYNNFVLPLIKRTFPELLSEKLVGVKPIVRPRVFYGKQPGQRTALANGGWRTTRR